MQVLQGGLLTFGGAYTAIPFIRNDTVGRGWMTDAQFLDGLALSGVLPAPLVIFSTFVGWISGGLAGALAITVGMFLPAFAFSLLFYEGLETIAEHRKLQNFLTGVAAGVVGLIVVAFLDLGREACRQNPEPPVERCDLRRGGADTLQVEDQAEHAAGPRLRGRAGRNRIGLTPHGVRF